MRAVVKTECHSRFPRCRGRHDGDVSWATQNWPSVRVPHPGAAQICSIDIPASPIVISADSVSASEDW